MSERCGEYAGYQVHKRAKEVPCAACRQANAEYIAAWRARNPKLQALTASGQMARDRAMRRLAAEFPAQFKALYDEEMAALPQRSPVWGAA